MITSVTFPAREANTFFWSCAFSILTVTAEWNFAKSSCPSISTITLHSFGTVSILATWQGYANITNCPFPAYFTGAIIWGFTHSIITSFSMNITNGHRAWIQWVNLARVGRFFPPGLAKNFSDRIANIPERHKTVRS